VFVDRRRLRSSFVTASSPTICRSSDEKRPLSDVDCTETTPAIQLGADLRNKRVRCSSSARSNLTRLHSRYSSVHGSACTLRPRKRSLPLLDGRERMSVKRATSVCGNAHSNVDDTSSQRQVSSANSKLCRVQSQSAKLNLKKRSLAESDLAVSLTPSSDKVTFDGCRQCLCDQSFADFLAFCCFCVL